MKLIIAENAFANSKIKSCFAHAYHIHKIKPAIRIKRKLIETSFAFLSFTILSNWGTVEIEVKIPAVTPTTLMTGIARNSISIAIIKKKPGQK